MYDIREPTITEMVGFDHRGVVVGSADLALWTPYEVWRVAIGGNVCDVGSQADAEQLLRDHGTVVVKFNDGRK